MSLKEYKMLIDGQWLSGKEHIEVKNPYNGNVLGTVPKASKEDVEAAIQSAQRAFEKVSQMPAHQRSKILEITSHLIAQYKEEIAAIIAREAGKAWKYTLGEAGRAVQTFKFAAEEAKQIHGETIPMDAGEGSENRMGFYLRMPVGVIGAISPFNFPLNLVAHKVAPAIAAGNTVVLKPASATPLTAIRLGELMMEAGLPAGALNIVFGSGSTSSLLYYPCHYEFTPTFIVDISAHFDKKLQAIQAYRSQLYHPEGSLESDEEETFTSTPDFLDRIVTRSKYYGSQIGVSYGEPFCMHEPLAIPDPVAHFGNRRRPAAASRESSSSKK